MSVVPHKCPVCGAYECDCFCQETEQCGCGCRHCPAWRRLRDIVILALTKYGYFLQDAGLMLRLVNKTMNVAVKNLLGVSLEAMKAQKLIHESPFYILMPSYRIQLAVLAENLAAVKWLTEPGNQSNYPSPYLKECHKSLRKSQPGKCRKFVEETLVEQMQKDWNAPFGSPHWYFKGTTRMLHLGES
jgi:hypothetical protein